MNLSAFCHAANDDLVPMRQVSRRFIERQCRAGYFLQIGQDKNHCNDKGNKIRNRNCNRNAVDTPNRIEQNHKRNVDYSLAQQGKRQRLRLAPGRLEDGDRHEIDGGGRTGKADDFQEALSIANGVRIVDKAAGDRHSREPQQQRAGARRQQAVQKRRVVRMSTAVKR